MVYIILAAFSLSSGAYVRHGAGLKPFPEKRRIYKIAKFTA